MEENKSNNVVKILLFILIILIVIGGIGAVVYFFVLKDNKSAKDTVKVDMPMTLEEYKEWSKQERVGDYSPIKMLDSSLKYNVDLHYTYKCNKPNEEIKETVEGHEVRAYCGENAYEDGEYDTLVIVDNMSFEQDGEHTCFGSTYYLNNNHVVEFVGSCAPGTERIVVYSNNDVLFNKSYIKLYEDYMASNNGFDYPPFVKNNNLYFVAAQNSSDDQKSRCNIYKVDISKEHIEYDVSPSFECSFDVAM